MVMTHYVLPPSILMWMVIIIIACITTALLLFYFILKRVDKREKEIASYLDECDEKLKKGEMTKEENEEIHFYWECGHDF